MLSYVWNFVLIIRSGVAMKVIRVLSGSVGLLSDVTASSLLSSIANIQRSLYCLSSFPKTRLPLHRNFDYRLQSRLIS